MALPELIPLRYAEEDAGYVSMRPAVSQTFRLNELVDMVVSVAGKDAEHVRKIFQKGSVAYNGYRYWWEPLETGQGEIEALVAGFPEDDPSRAFEAGKVTAIVLESGGGTQRNLIEISALEASEKKLFGKSSPWEVVVYFAEANLPRYEKYSYARRADLFRLTIAFETAQQLLAAMLAVAPRTLRHRWSTLRPPTALMFICPRS
jgi:hypothetical protein